jgi:hypothetical protein
LYLKVVATVALALHAAPHQRQATGCERTYTAPMAVRAIDATYRRGLPANRAQIARVQRYIRCQRDPSAQTPLRRLWKTKSRSVPQHGPAIASWYDDSGGTGCGFHAAYGIATLVAPCGSRFQICRGSTCIVATRDDSGPYVGGRTFDLDPALRDALRCSGLCTVSWRLLRS